MVVQEAERPVLPAALDRKQLLVAMLDAATGAVLGEPDEAAQQALKGRRFELRMRFGCDGEIDARRSWRFDEAAGALRVNVTPDSFAAAAKPGEGLTDDGHSPLGFVIARPNLLRSGCPAADYAAVTPSSALRFGLLPLHVTNAPRDEALLPSYAIVKKIAPDAVPTQGLDLILRGRLDSEGDAPVIVCVPSTNAIDCRATATFETISIEDPSNGRLIAEWSGR